METLFQNSVDRMLKRGNASMMVGASSWKEQFVEAFTVQAGQSISRVARWFIGVRKVQILVLF
jgi:hypothetical protein